MYSKIVNPLTGRKVSITGKIGKEIMNNYLDISQKGGNCRTTDKCRGTKKKCRDSDIEYGCEYVKSVDIISKGVDNYGCYMCEDDSVKVSKTEEDDSSDDIINISAPLPLKVRDDCHEIINIWLIYSIKTKDSNRKNSGFLEGNNAVLTSVHTSGSAIENPYSEHQWLNSWKYTRKTNIEPIRDSIYERYIIHPKLLIKLKTTHVWIDQGDMGGCSFAALINLCQLGNISSDWSNKVSKMKDHKKFKTLYERTYELTDDGYRDWISALTAMCWGIPDFGTVLTSLNYQCFKTLRGNYHSTLIAPKETSVEEYAEIVLSFIKHLLDNGYVVAVPTISHFVCIIGYNDNSLLFLGSFGEQISTGGLHELETDIFSPQEIADSIMDCLYVKVA